VGRSDPDNKVRINLLDGACLLAMFLPVHKWQVVGSVYLPSGKYAAFIVKGYTW
jgi:hypothetical protein